MTTLADKAILSGVDNRPPMLEKDMYDSWKSRIELYMMNRQHGRMILKSVENGPLIWPSIKDNGVTRPKKYSELSATKAIQADCDVKATNIILQGLPPEGFFKHNFGSNAGLQCTPGSDSNHADYCDISVPGNTFGGTAVGLNTLIAKGVGDVRTYTHDLVAKHLGVSLITLGDIDGFTKDLEIGKYELWSVMASKLRTKIMDSIRAMVAALLAINPNSDSLDKGNEAGVIPNNATGSRLISETNVEALLRVKFNSQLDIDTFSKSVEGGKYVDIFSKMSSDEIYAIVDAIVTIAKKFLVGDDNSRPNFTKQVVEPNHDDPIVHDVKINTKSTSYAGAAGANHKVQPKVTSNFRPLVVDPVFEGVNIYIPRKVVEKVSTHFEHTLYGYFIGKIMAFPVVEYYARNNWLNMGRQGLWIEPRSHKENPEVIDDDDVNDDEKKDDVEDKDNDDHNDHAFVGTQKELTDTVSPSTTTTSKDPHKKRRISSKYKHLPGALYGMCRRQGYMIKDMERKRMTTGRFWKVHGKVDQVLHEIVPQIAERATNDSIEDNLKRVANDPALWDVLKRKFKKSSTSNTTYMDDDFHSQHHDDHQKDVAPHEGEKRVKTHKTSRLKFTKGSSSKQSAKESTSNVSKQQKIQEWDAWVEDIIIDEDEVISKDETPELITEFQNIDK
nr:zinc knuckle CX2CX4HX4C [Tanacetum cinerariifolium]